MAKDNDDYKSVSRIATSLKEGKSANIQIFCEESGMGKTMEYDLAYSNPDCRLLITESMPKKHQDIIEYLMEGYSESNFEELGKVENIDGDILDTIIHSEWSDESDRKKGLIAAHYLKSVDALKGVSTVF